MQVSLGLQYIQDRAAFHGTFHDAACADYGPYAVGRHELGAVEQCQSLFALQGYRFPSGASQQFGARDCLPVVVYLAQPEQGE